MKIRKFLLLLTLSTLGLTGCGGNDSPLIDITITSVTEQHEHVYTSERTQEPTCNSVGYMTYTCECGDSYTREIPNLEHQLQKHVISATLDALGSVYDECVICGTIINSEITDTYTATSLLVEIKKAIGINEESVSADPIEGIGDCVSFFNEYGEKDELTNTTHSVASKLCNEVLKIDKLNLSTELHEYEENKYSAVFTYVDQMTPITILLRSFEEYNDYDGKTIIVAEFIGTIPSSNK